MIEYVFFSKNLFIQLCSRCISDALNKSLDSILAKGTSSTFSFPETAFTTVTAYQNQQVRNVRSLHAYRSIIHA